MKNLVRAAQGHWRYRDLVLNLIAANIKIRYEGTVFGFLWSLGVPIITIATYDLVFGIFLRSTIPNFTLYLVVGVLHYNLLSQILTQGSNSLIASREILQKVYFPRILVPTATVLSTFALWIGSALILLAVFSLLGGHYTWLLIPYIAALLLFVTMLWGLALGLAVLVAQFRDLRHFIEVGLMVMFWLVPIVYDPTAFDRKVQLIFKVNPFNYFFLIFHDLLVYDRLPGTDTVAIAVGWTAFSMAFGMLLFRSKAKWVTEIL